MTKRLTVPQIEACIELQAVDVHRVSVFVTHDSKHLNHQYWYWLRAKHDPDVPGVLLNDQSVKLVTEEMTLLLKQIYPNATYREHWGKEIINLKLPGWYIHYGKKTWSAGCDWYVSDTGILPDLQQCRHGIYVTDRFITNEEADRLRKTSGISPSTP